MQEACDLTYLAFDLSDKYRVPAMILGDGMIGQLMEPVELPPMRALSDIPEKDWATDGAFGEKRRILNSLLIDPDTLEPHVQALQKTYAEIAQNETRCETYLCEDAEIVLTAYGTVGRIAKSAVDALRKAGVKAGLIRPITLFPFPAEAYRARGQIPPRRFSRWNFRSGRWWRTWNSPSAARNPCISSGGRAATS